MNKKTIKRIITNTGKILGLLGLLFVFYKLYQEYTYETFYQQFLLILDILPLLIIINFISLWIGIYGWHLMLLNYTKKQLQFSTSYYYYAKTEIAKYLPGNIFHLLGRQALASTIGISQMQMAKITLLFSFLLLTGTILTSTLFSFFTHDMSSNILTLMGLSSIVCIISLIYLYPSFPMQKKLTMNVYLAISVALQGIMLGYIVMYQNDTFETNLFFQCISIYTISWLIGFITPGASGGLGVREGSFIIIVNYLQIDISSEIIIFSVLLVRLINIFTDITMYLSSYVLKKNLKELKL